MQRNDFTWGNTVDAFFQYVHNTRRSGVLMWPKIHKSTPEHRNRRWDRAEQRTKTLGRILNIEDLTLLKSTPSEHFQKALDTLVPYKFILVRYHVNFKHEDGHIKEGAFIEGQRTLGHIIEQLIQLEYIHEQEYGPIDCIWEEVSTADPESALILVVKFAGLRE